MKKILLILLVCFSYVAGTSQAIIQRGTSAVTVEDKRIMAGLNLFIPSYSDTTEASTQIGIDSCGAIIFTYNYGLWYRACSPKRWVQVIPGSSPTSDSLYWRIGGNDLSLLASDQPHLGSTDSSAINFITNSQIRATIAAGGIIRNASTDLKNLKYDTASKILYYYDDGGSGGGGITSLAQGFGMNNSANPITTTGTVAVDSGVIATRNYVDSFYNNVEQLNDSTFTIKRENGTQDTIQILTGIANVIDSLRRLPGSTIVQALKNGVWISQYEDSVGGGGGGSGTVTNVSRTNGYGISASVANPTTTPDITIAIDSATVFPQIRATIPSSTTDTTSLSNRINLKVNIADTGSMLTPYLRKVDTTAMLLPYLRKTDTSAMLSPYLRKIDTTVFARKSMPAYSFRANNTNAVADATNFTFKEFIGLTYSGTATWTFSTTAPSGTAVTTYSWQQLGKRVNYTIRYYQPTNGTGVTGIGLTLPSDMPNPVEPTGTGAADDVLYPATGFLTTNYATEPTIAGRAFLKINSGDTGYEIRVVSSSVSARYAVISGTYFAQ